MNNIKIHIDTRETDYNIKELYKILNNEITLTTTALTIGDIHIYYKEELLYMIERKTIGDFLNSIKSGHYHEQRSRMIESGVPMNKLILLIQGYEYNKIPSELYNLYSSVIASTLQLGFHIIYTHDIQDIGNFLLYVCKSIIKRDDEINTTQIINLNIKKKNVTPDNWYINSLQLIPGVSQKIAINISNKYPDITILKSELTKDENILVDVCKPGTKSKKLSKTISEYVMFK